MADAIRLGSRRELFVDRHVIDSMHGSASLKLHTPTPAGVAIRYDDPWERGEKGSTSFFTTVFKDDDMYRMYYRGNTHVCYAESSDAINWDQAEAWNG